MPFEIEILLHKRANTEDKKVYRDNVEQPNEPDADRPRTSKSIEVADESTDQITDEIESKREKLRSNKEVSNRKMEAKHDRKRNKKCFDFEIGQLVSVQITRIDRFVCLT